MQSHLWLVSLKCLIKPPCWSLRRWSRLHRQDPLVGYCERSPHQRRSNHGPAVCSCGEEPGRVAQHGTASVQGFYSHRWGHQVGDCWTPAHMDHQLFAQASIQKNVACETAVLQMLLRSPSLCLNIETKTSYSSSLNKVIFVICLTS